MAGVVFLRSLWRKPIWECVRPYLDPLDSVCSRTASMEWNVPGKYGPHGELLSSMPTSAPPFSADVLKDCALVAFHMIAEEGEGGEDVCHAPDLGGEWKVGYPKSPMWESGDEAWSEDESVPSNGSREGNVGNDALHATGLYGPGDKICLFLQDWELAKVALSCHMAPNMLCQEMHEVWKWRDATERLAGTAKSLSLTVDGL